MSTNLRRHIASLLLLAGFAVLAVGTMDTDTDTAIVESQAASYRLSATELYNEYSSNEVAADSKYQGKVVVVSGRVQSIGKDIMDNAYIVLGGGGFLDGVQCMFTEGQESSVARLSKGQQVVIKGEVAGRIVGNVLVNKCTLQ